MRSIPHIDRHKSRAFYHGIEEVEGLKFFYMENYEIENNVIIMSSEYKKNKKECNITNIPCDLCDGTLVIRESRYGKFMGCFNFPNCRFTK